MKRFGAFTLDTVSECLWRDGKRISLPPKPFAVLRYLVEHAARLVTHDELLDALWPDTYVQPQVLRTYMLDLRRILEDDAREPRFIQSHPKRGYSFLAAVTEVQHPAHDDSSAAEGLPGRERELAILNEALRKASVGRRQVVFLCGESGIGKTALVDFFSRRVECEQSGVVARGQCVPGLAGMQDFYPISDALRQLGDTRLHIAVPPSEVCACLEQIGEGRLLVLLLEDLQWADESTIAVLSALARRRGPAKLLIVAALVPQASSAAHAVSSLIQDLQIRGLCTEISLNPLSRRATLDLLRQHLVEGALPEALKDFVHDYSEGNPRIALAILDHVIAEKILVRREFDGAPQWELCGRLEEDGAAIPSDLARMVDLEMERLTPYEQSILEAASLVPVAFAAWMVAAALGDDVASVEECCDKLTKRVSIVKRAGEDQLPDGTQSSFYVFAHTFYRNALYRRQSPARRRARHIRVAERLRKLFRSREEFIAREAAAHYEAAGDLANAIAMLKVAAVRALKTQAFGEAADLHHHIACLEANSPIESWRPTQNNSPNELTRLISGESPSECDSTSVEA